MSAAQAAAAMGVSRATLFAMMGDGRITGYKIGSMRMFWAPEVRDLAAAIARTRKQGA